MRIYFAEPFSLSFQSVTNIALLLLYVVSTLSAIFFSVRPGSGRFLLARRLYWIGVSVIILFGTLAFIELRLNDAEGGALYGMALVIVTFGVLLAVAGWVVKLLRVVFGRLSRRPHGTTGR